MGFELLMLIVSAKTSWLNNNHCSMTQVKFITEDRMLRNTYFILQTKWFKASLGVGMEVRNLPHLNLTFMSNVMSNVILKSNNHERKYFVNHFSVKNFSNNNSSQSLTHK